MHLNELSRPGTREQAELALIHGGYERVAGGTYGVVYGKPGATTVLKLMHKKDVAYLAFVNLAMKHQSNPHFPRFSGKLIRLNDDYRAVRMERLVAGKGAEDNYRSFIAYALDLYIARKGNFSSMMPHYIESIQKAFYENPDLQDACDLIVANLGQYVNDLHPANVMFRGSTVVIIDPVAPHSWQADVAARPVSEGQLDEDAWFHTVKYGSTTHDVLKNPSRRELMRMINDDEYKQVRAICTPNDVYVFTASMTHGEVQIDLGWGLWDTARIFIDAQGPYLNQEDEMARVGTDEDHEDEEDRAHVAKQLQMVKDWCTNHPVLNRLFPGYTLGVR